MAKSRTIYICRQCGGMQHRWMGKCPDCGAWDALEEQRTTSAAGSVTSARTAGPQHPIWDTGIAAWSPATLLDADGSGGAAGNGEPVSGEPGTDRESEPGAMAMLLVDAAGAGTGADPGRPRQAVRMGAVQADVRQRISSGIGELDRVLGGGLVPGCVVLLGGEPGIGKSSILLQAAGCIARGVRGAATSAGAPGYLPSPTRPTLLAGPRTVLYVSSEESARQIQQRAERLGAIEPLEDTEPAASVTAAASPAISSTPAKAGRGGRARSATPRGDDPGRPGADAAGAGDTAGEAADPHAALPPLYVLDESNLARVVEQMRRLRPSVAVIDSIQMLYHPQVEASPGSVAQLRRCATELVYLAKRTGMVVMIIGHVTKEGQIAGPRLLEHLVDVVLYFEGDQYHAHRVIRGVKNRFGSTMEVGLFEMTGSGLREVPEGMGILPDRERAARPGSIICPALHGSRCFLVELQALTTPGFLGAAKRKVSGLDANRLAMLIAVLEKHGGLRLADQDVFASAVGGLRIIEPAADLPVGLAIAGAFLGRTLEGGTAVIGEVGLGGEIRPVTQLGARLREPLRRGYRQAIVPAASDLEVLRRELGGGMQLIPVTTVAEAVQLLN